MGRSLATLPQRLAFNASTPMTLITLALQLTAELYKICRVSNIQPAHFDVRQECFHLATLEQLSAGSRHGGC